LPAGGKAPGFLWDHLLLWDGFVHNIDCPPAHIGVQMTVPFFQLGASQKLVVDGQAVDGEGVDGASKKQRRLLSIFQALIWVVGICFVSVGGPNERYYKECSDGSKAILNLAVPAVGPHNVLFELLVRSGHVLIVLVGRRQHSRSQRPAETPLEFHGFTGVGCNNSTCYAVQLGIAGDALSDVAACWRASSLTRSCQGLSWGRRCWNGGQSCQQEGLCQKHLKGWQMTNHPAFQHSRPTSDGPASDGIYIIININIIVI
jgi:hypothetical protein